MLQTKDYIQVVIHP